jgi:hypothetical protein
MVGSFYPSINNIFGLPSYSLKGLHRERFDLPFNPVYSMTDEIEVQKAHLGDTL